MTTQEKLASVVVLAALLAWPSVLITVAVVLLVGLLALFILSQMVDFIDYTKKPPPKTRTKKK